MNKEQIYDESIAPLVTEILSLCQQHGIAMVASFAIPTPADPDLFCTCLLPDGDGKSCETFEKAANLIRFGAAPQAVAFTITTTAPQHA